jgi:hypothetical protein
VKLASTEVPRWKLALFKFASPKSARSKIEPVVKSMSLAAGAIDGCGTV